MIVWVRRGSGLTEPFEVPVLDLDSVLERSWRRRAGGRLLEPVPPAFLPTLEGRLVGELERQGWFDPEVQAQLRDEYWPRHVP